MASNSNSVLKNQPEVCWKLIISSTLSYIFLPEKDILSLVFIENRPLKFFLVLSFL